MIQYRTLQTEIIQALMVNKPKIVPVEPKLPAANRNSRTESQKLAASLKRKEWWEKKRAADAEAKAAQEKIKQLVPQPQAGKNPSAIL